MHEIVARMLPSTTPVKPPTPPGATDPPPWRAHERNTDRRRPEARSRWLTVPALVDQQHPSHQPSRHPVSSFPADTGVDPAASPDVVASAPRKRVLLVDYSQTGQLRDLATHLMAPLRADPAIEVMVLRLVPRQAYPYPWPFWRFLDAFPESAHLVAPELEPLALTGDEVFDLVILPWQVWYLAPSLPITAFLCDPVAQRVLRGKPVVSVIACRNMWLLAFDKFTMLLADSGARLIDNVVYTDPGPALATFITTPPCCCSAVVGPCRRVVPTPSRW